MALFVIGDLHLSLGTDKPMDLFGENWRDHHKKIRDNWIELIGTDDTVLIPGDISWAMTLDEALIDLNWIHELPGRKILIKGNHDYWWGSIKRLNSLYENMDFLQNSFYSYKDIAICGSRGWTSPNKNKFTDQDEKIYERELNRIKLSLDEAVKNKFKTIYVMSHYPPTNELLEPSGFTEIYEAYGVSKVFYGHLHGEVSFDAGLKGEKNGVTYYLTSCDYLDFIPLKVID
jgi:predicted phosphohydrolase